MNNVHEVLKSITIPPETIDKIINEIEDPLLNRVADDKVEHIHPRIFIYFLDVTKGDGRLYREESLFEHLGKTSEDRIQQFFEIGRTWSAKTIHIPICVCFCTEAWVTLVEKENTVPQDAHRVEKVILSGLSINKQNHLCMYSIKRDESRIVQLVSDVSIHSPDDDQNVCSYLLEGFYHGYFAGLWERDEASGAVTH